MDSKQPGGKRINRGTFKAKQSSIAFASQQIDIDSQDFTHDVEVQELSKLNDDNHFK
jgi:hypothetical protein